jgi:rhodanese-related sulfurtransferase
VTSYPIVEAEPMRARELIADGWYVLDIRTDAEWAEGHIPGSHHMQFSEVVSGIGSRVVEPVLVVCTTGSRSWRVAKYLALQGIEVANLVGGIHQWEFAGLPVER